ncbi:unnamed protein product [Rhizophagus irregularis]|uniref:Uncharacterized protein n=1 Tax=Rhizophagus irregularis TaxID=588596 RepID=A0A915YQD4_9GLOM|nr:unnamed protein product [Rhizophagus irregularis]CAB5313161.1 unnamed protein product [Rhizophagus irregularis]
MINHIILNSAHIASKKKFSFAILFAYYYHLFTKGSPGKSGTWWKYCNIGIGAFLHEVGHCLSAALSPSGIMSRGFNYLNCTLIFMVKEPNNPFPTTPSE